jgi:hypothetical protein
MTAKPSPKELADDLDEIARKRNVTPHEIYALVTSAGILRTLTPTASQREAAEAAARDLYNISVDGLSVEEIANLIEPHIRRALKRAPADDGWLPIEMAPKNRKIIAGYHNKLGKWRTTMARYYEAGTLDSYNDDTEDGFAAEGWYEESETHEELLPCDETPTHWRPLPPAPTTAEEEEK